MKTLADLLIPCLSRHPALFNKVHKRVKATCDMRFGIWQSINEQISGWDSELLFLDTVELMAKQDR